MARRRHVTRRTLAGFGGAAVALVAAGMLFADSGSLDLQVADRTGYDSGTTAEGAIVEYIGDQNTTFGSSGTGTFGTFVQVQNTPSESGYNTDGDTEFDTGSSPTFNHAMLVSDIPVVSINGQRYWELWADINDSNGGDGAQISLNDVEIYFTADDELTGYPFTGTATKKYDYAGAILINDVNQGSGRGDLRYSIPLTNITIPAECSYKNPACTTYFVLYSQWGTSGGNFISDSGFEEWKVKTYPYVNVTKTAATTYTRTFDWTIDKSVDPDTWDLFTGESGTSEYTVAVTKGAGTDSAQNVTGTITISNPGNDAAVVSSVTDTLTGSLDATVVCPVSLPRTLTKNQSLVCTYSRALPDSTARTNTATATLDYGGVFQGTAAVTFGAPTSLVRNSITVTDTNSAFAGPKVTSASASWPYDVTFDCDADEGENDNTATITETGQTADATVTVNCHEIDVSKTAETSLTRTWEWDIDKSVSPATWDLFTGESGTSEYTVDIDKVGSSDAEFAVEGVITVANNTPLDATINSVGDVVSAAITANVTCTGITFPYQLVAGGSFTCDYSATLPDGTSRTNTATAVRQNHDYDSDGAATADGTTNVTGQASVTFSDPEVKDVNASVNVTDSIEGDLGEFSDDDTVTYSTTFDCDADEGDTDNTATIVETGQDADATVTVNCHEIEVRKDADASYTRTYHWTIDKSSEDPSGHSLTLNPGTIYADYPYEITVDLDDPAYTDSDWAVHGDIDIHNPAPIDATINGVVDVLTPAGSATVDCGVTFPYTLAAGDTLTCSYDKDLGGAVDQSNKATATRQNYAYDKDLNATSDGTTTVDGTANATFGAPTTRVDEEITVVDDNGTPGNTADDHDFGTVRYNEVPKTFGYDRTFGPFTADDCGTVTVTNTAEFTTNDTETSGDDSWTVEITIPCPTGCTLTQGYWKTHSEYGPAPEDENWDNLPGGLGPDTVFFASGKTWYQVFWTNPKGGNAYYILAHQYEAAVLNILAGADSPSSVDAAITWAEGFFAGRDPDAKLSKALRADAINYAGILGSYNEGDIGPGHCSEDGAARSAGG